MFDHPQSYLKRFHSKVPHSGEDDCWPFDAAPNNQVGHRVISVGGHREQAHRVAFFLANGWWPRLVRHSCDNPPCCNPKHLLPGTNADNSRDMVERGRTHSGERHHNATIPDAEIAHIRSRTSVSTKELAVEYGVNVTTIRRIRSGNSR